jgi:hypothetical protein
MISLGRLESSWYGDVRAEYFPHETFIQKSIAIGLSGYPNVIGYVLFILGGVELDVVSSYAGILRNLEDHRTDYRAYYKE